MSNATVKERALHEEECMLSYTRPKYEILWRPLWWDGIECWCSCSASIELLGVDKLSFSAGDVGMMMSTSNSESFVYHLRVCVLNWNGMWQYYVYFFIIKHQTTILLCVAYILKKGSIQKLTILGYISFFADYSTIICDKRCDVSRHTLMPQKKKEQNTPRWLARHHKGLMRPSTTIQCTFFRKEITTTESVQILCKHKWRAFFFNSLSRLFPSPHHHQWSTHRTLLSRET